MNKHLSNSPSHGKKRLIMEVSKGSAVDERSNDMSSRNQHKESTPKSCPLISIVCHGMRACACTHTNQQLVINFPSNGTFIISKRNPTSISSHSSPNLLSLWRCVFWILLHTNGIIRFVVFCAHGLSCSMHSWLTNMVEAISSGDSCIALRIYNNYILLKVDCDYGDSAVVRCLLHKHENLNSNS